MRGEGHGLPVDWWAAGMLCFELLTGTPPFSAALEASSAAARATPSGRDELLVGRAITEHVAGGLPFGEPPPSDGGLRELQDLAQQLAHPVPARRMGAGRDGADALQRHAAFAGLDWDALAAGKLESPLAARAASKLTAAQKQRAVTSELHGGERLPSFAGVPYEEPNVDPWDAMFGVQPVAAPQDGGSRPKMAREFSGWASGGHV